MLLGLARLAGSFANKAPNKVTTNNNFQLTDILSHTQLCARNSTKARIHRHTQTPTRTTAKNLGDMEKLTLKKNSVSAGGRTESKLVEGENLAAGLHNAGTGTLSHTKSANGKLGNLQKTDIVSDGANDNGHLLTALVVGLHLAAFIRKD